MVNGVPVSPSYVKDIGFCPQGDIHDESSTVYEAFKFSALLRQNPKVSEEDKTAYAENILETLGLNTLRDAVIGSLPLEAKRRTSIGVELCAKPKLLLFLDEPTSVSLTDVSTLHCTQLTRVGTRQPRRPHYCQIASKVS
jgi:ATP-binding cassette subfamily G (WHITE) protein 2 (SNQ2)